MIAVDITLRRGDFVVDAAFETPASGITALFGRSGSGKTTIVNAIAGLVRPDRGGSGSVIRSCSTPTPESIYRSNNGASVTCFRTGACFPT